MATLLYRLLFRIVGVTNLYREIVVKDRLHDIQPQIRNDLQRLLEDVNENNPFFAGKFTSFLRNHANSDHASFLQAYSKLPSFSKEDYAKAGQSVMAQDLAGVDIRRLELKFKGRPLNALLRLRRGDFLMPMATGGSSSLPLVVYMTKRYMFSMLFTFFKCWYRMGWRPGEKMMIFYPKNTYNIDDMVKFNPFSWLTGFRYHLFDKVDEVTVRRLVDDINRYKPKLLLVFPSPMNMIAHAIRKYNIPLKYHPPLINVSGETFFDCQRANIQSIFSRSKIEDSYGSVELGEIAHETQGGLEIFANAAYVETEPNEAGQPEMVVTRLGLSDFPFVRYRMRDIAHVEFQKNEAGEERYVITRIEGKDSNFILSENGERFYPSFFNQLVNDINAQVHDSILEIKVYERDQKSLEVQFIVNQDRDCERIRDLTRKLLAERMQSRMHIEIKFVDFIDHDYRRKYRVIERIGDVEFAGGIVGDADKIETVRTIESIAGR
ncbi:MAG TPA: hypothetical protein PKD64_04430 [Pirellulaceae bacterium]|nr:hypothetical protein [Pirellulaceae bacterium]HMO91420.1 hypothetical protein [Pirellulaceae bacterium]HMP69503.1 hypothetical protein [Pirellulaceae bacterium]